MPITFSGEIWYWRGPSPYYFATVPPEACGELKAISGPSPRGIPLVRLTSGWMPALALADLVVAGAVFFEDPCCPSLPSEVEDLIARAGAGVHDDLGVRVLAEEQELEEGAEHPHQAY